jgi:AraC family transcriptional regulator
MIEDHEDRPPLLDDLARESCLSKFHFLRAFTATFGLSPMAFADRVRAERALGLLQRSQLSVGQIAERLGFESQSAFAKMIQRHAGMTPRAFKADRRR